MVDRIVLVGFMGAGKTTVGRLLASRLDWRFIDFDARIEATSGQRITDIFREHGESCFRKLEAELTHEIERERRVVLAPGGGWMAQPGLVSRLRQDSLIVWLQVSPETAFQRSRAHPDLRPLLDVADPVSRIRELMDARASSYAEADVRLETDGRTPEAIVADIIEIVRSRAASASGAAEC